MPLHISWLDVALRLALATVAGALLGTDRSRHEHPAGLRTSLLVTLAACISMVQMNQLMPTNGKASDSFAVLDLMRLPLGVLTGVGFIGAGAILKRSGTILGVTTAATMWFATIVGLCMGGGQLALGCISTALGCATLWGLKSVEHTLHRTQRASLDLTAKLSTFTEQTLRRVLVEGGLEVKSLGVSVSHVAEALELYDIALRWCPKATDDCAPPVIVELARTPGVLGLKWAPAGAPSDE